MVIHLLLSKKNVSVLVAFPRDGRVDNATAMISSLRCEKQFNSDTEKRDAAHSPAI